MKIEWFTTKDMKKRRNEFRPFFREFVDRILKEVPKIRKFLKKNKTKRKRIAKNKTYKNH